MTDQRQQTLQLRGSLTSADMRQTRPTHFEVPPGITQIHFQFRPNIRHAPGQKLPHQISMSIFDPNGPRIEVTIPSPEGEFINTAQATPGGRPGPIPAGRWTLFLLVHRLLSDIPVDYELDITMSSEPVTEAPATWKAGQVASRGPGWYRGDLHAHTFHSDGSWSVPDLVHFWKSMGVDFMTLSDHNTISGLPHVHSLADDSLLTLSGIEITTFFGHAVAVGVERWFDWRDGDGNQISMPELAQQVIESGALYTIAHPMNPGDPLCCGCRWEHYDMMPGNALAVEVWNGIWDASNQESLQWFYHWLNEGYRPTAVSGTDLHGPPPENVRGAVNVVYAQDLTQEAIVEAIKAGRSYISAGPELLLTATSHTGVEGMVGDILPVEDATVTAAWSDGHEGDSIRLVVDGKVYREQFVGVSGELQWHLTTGQARWIALELRDAEDGLWAVTNPIFFERK